MADVSCRGCKYFEGYDARQGRCHRFPPREGELGTPEFSFPIVLVGEWCGEFEEGTQAARHEGTEGKKKKATGNKPVPQAGARGAGYRENLAAAAEAAPPERGGAA